MIPHLNHLEMVQMRGHNIWFQGEVRKIIIKYSLLTTALEKTLLLKKLNPVLKGFTVLESEQEVTKLVSW